MNTTHSNTATFTTRKPNHLAMSHSSDIVHAASDLNRRHVLACNGRAMQASAWNGVPSQITCKACISALATGRAVWVGADRLPQQIVRCEYCDVVFDINDLSESIEFPHPHNQSTWHTSAACVSGANYEPSYVQ